MPNSKITFAVSVIWVLWLIAINKGIKKHDNKNISQSMKVSFHPWLFWFQSFFIKINSSFKWVMVLFRYFFMFFIG